jgi:hypothetical protein
MYNNLLLVAHLEDEFGTWGKISNLLFQFQMLAKKMLGKGYLSDSIVFNSKFVIRHFSFFEEE